MQNLLRYQKRWEFKKLSRPFACCSLGRSEESCEMSEWDISQSVPSNPYWRTEIPVQMGSGQRWRQKYIQCLLISGKTSGWGGKATLGTGPKWLHICTCHGELGSQPAMGPGKLPSLEKQITPVSHCAATGHGKPLQQSAGIGGFFLASGLLSASSFGQWNGGKDRF